MLQKVVSAMKGSIRQTIPVLLQHNSQADSRCSASAAPLASQSAIVSRFDGSGAKILTRLDFGENEIAHLQRTASFELLTPRRHLQGSLDLVGRSHPREEHVAVVHVHHFRRLISKHFRVDAALEDVVIELAFCDPIQAEYSLRDVGVLARDVVRGKGSEHTLAGLLLCVK